MPLWLSYVGERSAMTEPSHPGAGLLTIDRWRIEDPPQHISEGLASQPLHRAGPMHLDGANADTELMSDYLVRNAPGQPEHDISFAR